MPSLPVLIGRGGMPAIQLTPGQAMAVVLILVGIAVAVAAYFLLDVLMTRGAALALKLTGHTPPKKSPTRAALDELDRRIRHS